MTTTRQLLADRADRPDQLVAAGEILDLRFGDGAKALSLRAARLFHLLVAATGADACVDKIHVLPIESLNSFHISLEEFVDTCQELFGVMVRMEIRNAKGEPAVKLGPLLSDVERDLDFAGELRFQLSPVLRLVLEKSNYWAVLSRRAVMAFESRYALRVYEIIAIRVGLETKTSEVFELDDLRQRLGVPAGKLRHWHDVKRIAIDPAVAEVNQLSGFRVSADPIKRGKSVWAVRLTWEQLDTGGRAAVARELNNVRSGRKARRDGTVETLVDPDEEETIAVLEDLAGFPATGSIRSSKWADLARQALPSPMPDLDQVATRFRSWAKTKGIALAAPNIGKVFVGFCQAWGDDRPPAPPARRIKTAEPTQLELDIEAIKADLTAKLAEVEALLRTVGEASEATRFPLDESALPAWVHPKAPARRIEKALVDQATKAAKTPRRRPSTLKPA